jgi:hypothetical protein
MTRDEIIDMAREADIDWHKNWNDDGSNRLEHLAALIAARVAATERKEWPNLEPVINWLENGCDPKEAAKELRLYADAIRARGQE